MATKSKFMPSTLCDYGWVPFNFEVGVNLAIEGYRPGEKVDPPDHVDHCLLRLVYLAQHKLNDRFIN